MLVAMPAAHAGDTSCGNDVTLTGMINGNVVVLNGAECDLEGVTVTGNVLVGKGATLVAGFYAPVTTPYPGKRCRGRTQHDHRQAFHDAPPSACRIKRRELGAATPRARLSNHKVAMAMPAPLTCKLLGARVASISGNLLANQCGTVGFTPATTFVDGVSIGGSLGVMSCTGGLVAAGGGRLNPVTVQGNVLCQNNSAPCFVSGVSIGGNANVSKNSGGQSVVRGNVIDGNLLCFGNTGGVPAVTNNGSVNTVAGREFGQCPPGF
jgi:hypothetical protein